MGFVRVADVDRVAVRIGVDRRGGDAKLAARPHDANGDLTTIGDEDFAEEFSLHCWVPRKLWWSGADFTGRSTYGEERLVGADDLALFDVNVADATGDGRDDVVLHLHRLEHRDHVAKLHVIAHLHRHLDDQPLHRRDHRAFARPWWWRTG